MRKPEHRERKQAFRHREQMDCRRQNSLSATETEEARVTRFGMQYELTPTGGLNCARRLAGKRGGYDVLSWYDHHTLWMRGREAVLFQSQPYQVLPRDLEHLEAFCAEHRLRFVITDEPRVCWYWPGEVLSVFVFAGECPVHDLDPQYIHVQGPGPRRTVTAAIGHRQWPE